VLDPSEARAPLDSIDIATHAGLRDRALIALMVYSFARIGATLGMAIEDGRRQVVVSSPSGSHGGSEFKLRRQPR
jgi:integrase